MTRPSALVIAGLDPSGGAGLLADAATLRDHDLRVCGVCTALTVQNTQGTYRIEPVARDVLAEQLQTVLTDIEVAVVKVGMLCGMPQAEVIEQALRYTNAPIVFDPVAGPSVGPRSVGDSLRDVVACLAEPNLILTPNRSELDEMRGDETPQSLLASLGITAIVATPGIDETTSSAALELFTSTQPVQRLPVTVDNPQRIHGTGCVFSSAIAGSIATKPLADAVTSAVAYVAKRAQTPEKPGLGAPSLH